MGRVQPAMAGYTALYVALLACLVSWLLWPNPSSELHETMKACIRTSSGPAFSENHPRPPATPKNGELLVKIRAAAINPVDYKMPKIILGPVMGLDFAGVVEAVPEGEDKFKVGDEVYGTTDGSLAEYAIVKVGRTGRKSKELSFEEAAALPVAHITGLQGLRDKGGMKEGDKVLVIGASGGCGLAGVQLAKAMGAAEIVGVCSGRNKEVVMENGATKVVDYTKEKVDEVFPGGYFDLVYDTATGSGAGENYFDISERLLNEERKAKNVILNGGPWTWISYFIGLQKSNRKLLLTDMNTGDLEELAKMFDTKVISRPVIFKTFPLDAEGVKEAFDVLQSRRTVGKIVFSISSD